MSQRPRTDIARALAKLGHRIHGHTPAGPDILPVLEALSVRGLVTSGPAYSVPGELVHAVTLSAVEEGVFAEMADVVRAVRPPDRRNIGAPPAAHEYSMRGLRLALYGRQWEEAEAVATALGPVALSEILSAKKISGCGSLRFPPATWRVAGAARAPARVFHDARACLRGPCDARGRVGDRREGAPRARRADGAPRAPRRRRAASRGANVSRGERRSRADALLARAPCGGHHGLREGPRGLPRPRRQAGPLLPGPRRSILHRRPTRRGPPLVPRARKGPLRRRAEGRRQRSTGRVRRALRGGAEEHSRATAIRTT